jgi:HD-like signal output (HDOD) protein
MTEQLNSPSSPSDSAAALDRQLEASLRDIGIPPRPSILEKVTLEARADEPDMNYLSELILGDVALAAGLIKTANSPFFGYRQKTRNVRDALMMLGLKSAGNAIAGLILRRVFPPSPQLARFWDASERTAQLSAWLVQKLGVRFGVISDDAYTFALFRDCGIPIMMRRFPGYHDTLARANEDEVRSFTTVEEQDTPTNHAVVGGLMVQSWWLPEDLCTAMRQHHNVAVLGGIGGAVSGAALRQIALAQLAEKLHQSITGLNRTREWAKLGAACLAVLDLGAEIPPELVVESREFLAGLPPA